MTQVEVHEDVKDASARTLLWLASQCFEKRARGGSRPVGNNWWPEDRPEVIILWRVGGGAPHNELSDMSNTQGREEIMVRLMMGGWA